MCFLSGVTWHPPADPQGANSGWSGLGNLSSSHMRETTKALTFPKRGSLNVNGRRLGYAEKRRIKI